MKIVIIHGAYGNPNENWFPWLKNELEKLGQEVFVPKFPTPENQTPENWCKVLQKDCPWEFGSDTILVGHSLGATYILNILNRERAESVKASFLVAGFTGDLGDPQFDNINHDFTHQDFDWDLIARTAGKITVIGGDNDPYVPKSEIENLARNLRVEPIFIENGGHLNAAAGYTEFPYLLNLIKEEL